MNNSLVDEIKSRCNIVDVIGRYVELKRTGSNYKCLCPFHNEKTPSFIVSESKQFFNCFGCGESGDVISFLMKIENIDFFTAISKLSEEYGIEMDKFGYKNESRKNQIYEMNREAAKFYFKNLTEKKNEGFAYLKRRGLDPKTITKFGLGFAENEWQELREYLASKNYTEQDMMDAGLISNSKGRYYDKFRNRVMFPIFNTRGNVIGFGGRTLGNDDAKYLNSPESSVFSKKNNLYGLNLTRKDINNSNCAIVVEGYMDLVSLYKSGITNVAASLGTALTENQCQLLKRYTENVILSYDADSAGQKAALRGIELLHNAGLKAKVLHISDGKDPDEFVNKNGKQAFLKLVEEALPYAEYKISITKNRHDLNTSEGRIDFLKEIKGVLSSLSPIEADVYIKKIAQETQISEGAIRRELNEYDDKKSQQPGRVPQNIKKGNELQAQNANSQGNVMLQKQLIKLISVNPEYIDQILKYESVFISPSYYRIYSTMKSIYTEGGEFDIKKAADVISPEDALLLQDAVDTVIFPTNSEKVLEDCIRLIEIDKLQVRQKEILEMLDFLPDSIENRDKIDILSKELMSIQVELQKYRK